MFCHTSSTSTITQSMSMSMEGGSWRLQRRKWCPDAAAATDRHGGDHPQKTPIQRGWIELWCTLDCRSQVRTWPAEFNGLSTVFWTANLCEHSAATAAMVQKRANGSLEFLDGYWKLFNSITPMLLVGCGTYCEENKTTNNVSNESKQIKKN